MSWTCSICDGDLGKDHTSCDNIRRHNESLQIKFDKISEEIKELKKEIINNKQDAKQRRGNDMKEGFLKEHWMSATVALGVLITGIATLEVLIIVIGAIFSLSVISMYRGFDPEEHKLDIWWNTQSVANKKISKDQTTQTIEETTIE